MEKKLAFAKLQGLFELQMHHDLKFGSVDKLNNKACSEIVNVIAAVIMDCLTDYFKECSFNTASANFKECSFITASANARETCKMSKKKELVFGEVIIKGYNGVVPCCFLLKKCQSLKEIGGRTGKATFEAMKNATT